MIDDEDYEATFLQEVLGSLSYEATIKYFNNARDGIGYIREPGSNIFLIISDSNASYLGN